MKENKKGRVSWLRTVMLYLPRAKDLWLLVLIVVVVAGVIHFYGGAADLWSVLTKVEILIAIATALLTFLTWSNTQRIKEQYMRTNPERNGEDAALLIIDVMKKNIAGQVESYCKNKGEELGFILTQKYENENLMKTEEGQPFQLSIKDGLGRNVVITGPGEVQAGAEEVKDFYQTLEKACWFFRSNGISSLHVFYSGPVTLAIFLGDFLSNNFDVCVYGYNNGFEEWGLMNKKRYLE